MFRDLGRLAVALLLGLLAIAAAVTYGSERARAQTIALCAPLPDILRQFRDRHGEWVVMTADMGNRGGQTGRLYITRSDSGGWSVIVARGDIGCVIMAGTGAEFVKGF